jgi:hypothetical protein
MKKTCLVLVLAVVACGFLAGCGGGGGVSLSSADAKVFNDAPAPIKQAWEKALALDKSNDYVAAGTAFFELQRENLSASQSNSVRTALIALNQRMAEAAFKGDPAANKALETFRTMNSRRPR